MAAPRISVIIPTRRHEAMTRTIESVMAQTEQDLEIIVRVDQGRGQGWARNRAAEQASGEYLVFSDTDITWMPTAFERYLWAMDHGSVPPGWKYGYVYGGYHLMLHGEILKTLCNRAWDWEALKQQNFVSTMSLVPRSLFLEYRFDETFRRLEDWELWLRLGCDGYAGAFCGSIAFTTEARAGVTFGGEYGHDVYETALKQKLRV